MQPAASWYYLLARREEALGRLGSCKMNPCTLVLRSGLLLCIDAQCIVRATSKSSDLVRLLCYTTSVVMKTS